MTTKLKKTKQTQFGFQVYCSTDFGSTNRSQTLEVIEFIIENTGFLQSHMFHGRPRSCSETEQNRHQN